MHLALLQTSRIKGVMPSYGIWVVSVARTRKRSEIPILLSLWHSTAVVMPVQRGELEWACTTMRHFRECDCRVEPHSFSQSRHPSCSPRFSLHILDSTRLVEHMMVRIRDFKFYSRCMNLISKVKMIYRLVFRYPLARQAIVQIHSLKQVHLEVENKVASKERSRESGRGPSRT